MGDPVRKLLLNIMVLMGGQVMRIAVQAAYFVVIARVLGVSDFGAFAALVALAALVTPFSSLGTNVLMMREVSRDRSLASAQWARACTFTVGGGLVLALVMAVLGPWIAPTGISFWTIFLIVLADLVGFKLIETVGSLWQAMGSTRPLVILPAALNAFRLAGALCLEFIFGGAAIDGWAVLYVLASVPFALCITIWCSVKVGVSWEWPALRVDELKRGMLYAMGAASQTVYNDIDKAMLARIASTASAGIYSAAFRIIEMAYVPIRAIASATYPLYFQHGQAGLRSALSVSRKVLPLALGYGLCASLGLVLAAPVAPLVLGPGYDDAVEIVRWLAPVLLIRGISFLAADALTGADHQGYRTAVQIGLAATNVVMNLVLLPIYGIGGAVAATLGCELLLAVLLWGYVPFGLRADDKRGVRNAGMQHLKVGSND